MKVLEQLLKRHKANLIDLEKQDKKIRTQEFREETIKQYKEDKELAKEQIKQNNQLNKKLEVIAKSDALKEADKYIQSLMITSKDAIEKTKLTIEALEKLQKEN